MWSSSSPFLMKIHLGKRVNNEETHYDNEMKMSNKKRRKTTAAARRMPTVVLKNFDLPTAAIPKVENIEEFEAEQEKIDDCGGGNEEEKIDDDYNRDFQREAVKCPVCDQCFVLLPDFYEHCREEHPILDEPNNESNKVDDRSAEEMTGDGQHLLHKEEHQDDDHVIPSSQISPTTPVSNGAKIRTTWCDICKKHLATVSSRNLHMRIHTGERPFVCPFCNKSFTQNVHLRSHISVHTGAKPYVCELCGKGFVASRTLKIHMMSHNSRDNPHLCNLCGRKFLLRSHLVMHLQTQHQIQQGSDQSSITNQSQAPTTTTSSSSPTSGSAGRLKARTTGRRSGSKYRLQPPQRVLVAAQQQEEKEAIGDHVIDDQEHSEIAMEDRDGDHKNFCVIKKVEQEWQSTPAITTIAPPAAAAAASPRAKMIMDTRNHYHHQHHNRKSSSSSPLTMVSQSKTFNITPERLQQTAAAYTTNVTQRYPTTGNNVEGEKKKPAVQQQEGPAINANTHAAPAAIQSTSSSSSCSNCAIVESELQLLKNELAVIKQFLGSKLTLMEQKIDNIRVLIK